MNRRIRGAALPLSLSIAALSAQAQSDANTAKIFNGYALTQLTAAGLLYNPQAKATYGKYAAPYVDRGVEVSRHIVNDKVVPAAGAVVGSAMSVWDAANETRAKLSGGRIPVPVIEPP